MTNVLNARATISGPALVLNDDLTASVTSVDRVEAVSDEAAIAVLSEVDFPDGVTVTLSQKGFTPSLTEPTITGIRVFVPGPTGLADAVTVASGVIATSGALVHEGFEIELSELELEEPELTL